MPSISTMSSDSNNHLLSMVAWGTKLSFGLYDFSANVSSATGDVDRLAKEVNLLSLGLRQIGANLKEDGSLPSNEAYDTVRRISALCQEVFQEIEAMVPVRQLQDAQMLGSLGSDMALATRLRDELDWNALSKSKTQYLLEHLESLKLTLSVMSQTLYTAKITAWSRYDNHFFWNMELANTGTRHERSQLSVDAVVTQRLQMESLVIEQQLSLLRAYKQFDEFNHKVANAPRTLTHGSHSMALIRREDGPNPGALIPYQEPSLAVAQRPQNDMDDLARVRSVSSPFVDVLLNRWTRISEIEYRFRRLELTDGPRDAPPRLVRRDSNWRPTEVESDPESDDEHSRRRPKLRLSTPGPVLMPVDGGSDLGPAPPVGLGVGIPGNGGNLRPPNGTLPPQGASSWSAGTGSYFPSTHGQSRPRRSPGPSPLSSPRASFSSSSPRTSFSSSPQTNVASGSLPIDRPLTAFRADGASAPPQQAPQQQKPAIPWRVRVNQYYWEYRDAQEVDSNTRIPLEKAMKDFKAVTEITSEFVSRDAVEERGIEYQKFKKAVGGDRRSRTKMENCLYIEGALSFSDIRRLVERTEQIRNPPPRSPRPRAGSGTGGPVRPPHLDRSNTAPILSPILRGSRHNSSSSYTPNHTPSNSTNSDSDNNTPSASSSRHEYDRERRNTFSSRRDSSSHRRGDSIRERDDESTLPRRSSRSRRDSDAKYRPKGNAKAMTLTKIAAGAGLATLLDGLADAFV
jgi:hypothetical protein